MQGNRSMETEWSPALWHCRSFESPGSSHSSLKWTKPTLTIKTFINRVCQCVSRIIERRGYRIRGFLFGFFFFSALSGKKKLTKPRSVCCMKSLNPYENKACVSICFLSGLFILIPACASLYHFCLEAVALWGLLQDLYCACVCARVGRSPVWWLWKLRSV